ncbi:MAG: hypothetical protein JXA64_04085 [Candidatus Fermentibacteraceae bacterium]|nr:hypothetical protein [Candidatus Fermentibacteraceae bacterium]MBN2608271.1 hypothetical protein [Candidatus Fermentibacteraceae bacterium]
MIFGLSGRDRAFALRLLRETVVWRARLDRALARYCSRPLETLEEPVLAALRAGAAQLLILGTPPHAAVSETVSALKGHRAGGLVNAVLRKLAAEGEPDTGSASLAERWSHPADLVDRWISRFGTERTIRLMEWNNGVPAIGACIGKAGDDPECGGRYLGDYRVLQRSGSSPLGSLDCPAYIQDEAAALVGRSMAAMAAGGEVLEIGAAPGGKTHHLQASASLVISMDSSPARMERWAQNRRRLGWTGAFPLVGSGTAPPLARQFDMVLVDSPCTNTGVYRRRPDARWNWSSAYLIQMAGLQRNLLDSAAELVAPSGVLAYSTCSLEDEENVQQVERFESIHGDYRRVDLQVPAELASEGMISIFPTEHGIDGLFAAAWRRET